MKLPIGMAALVVVQVGVTGTAGVPREPFNPNDSQLEPNRTVYSTGGCRQAYNGSDPST